MGSKTVLFADDDKDFRQFMTEAFTEVAGEIKMELIVTEAVDGAEAIKFFDESLDKGKSFDIVVTDYMMPSASGLDVIKHIINKNPVPIIVISAYKDRSTDDFVKEGALFFLSKPFKFEQMVKAFSEIVTYSLVKEDISRALESIKELENITS